MDKTLRTLEFIAIPMALVLFWSLWAQLIADMMLIAGDTGAHQEYMKLTVFYWIEQVFQSF